MLRKNVERKRIPYLEFKHYLDSNNISQAYIGEIIGLKKSAVNQKINGTGGDFTVEEVKLICIELGISAQEYFFPELVSKSTTCKKVG